MPRAETTRTLRRRFAAVLAGVVAGGLLLPLDAAADPGKGKGPRQDKGGRFVRMLQENAQRLGLDETSLREIESVAGQDRDAIQALRAREENEERVMRELLEKRTPDESAVMRQAEVLGGIDTEQDKLRLRTMIRVRQLLTPEQLAELSKLREERRKERKERRGRWRDKD
jgi:Spy/CpxP family protein refolding chaperone